MRKGVAGGVGALGSGPVSLKMIINRRRFLFENDYQLIYKRITMRAGLARYSLISLAFLAGCSDGDDPETPDAGMPDAPLGCNPATVLPNTYRPSAKVATTLLTVTTTDAVTSGTADATAGGISMAADNPYLYLDLKTGVKVDINDLE